MNDQLLSRIVGKMTVNNFIFLLISCIFIEFSHFVPIQVENDQFFLKDSERDRDRARDKFTFIDRTRDPCFPVCESYHSEPRVEFITDPPDHAGGERSGEDQSEVEKPGEDIGVKDTREDDKMSIQRILSLFEIFMKLITKLNPKELSEFWRFLWGFLKRCKTCDITMNRSDFMSIMLQIEYDLMKGLEYDEELVRMWKCHQMFQNRDQQFFRYGIRQKLIKGGFDRDVDEKSLWPHSRFPDGRFSKYPGDPRNKSDVGIESLWTYHIHRYPDGTRNEKKFPGDIFNTSIDGGHDRKRQGRFNHPDSHTSPPSYVSGLWNMTKDDGNIMKLGNIRTSTDTPLMTSTGSMKPEKSTETLSTTDPPNTSPLTKNTLQSEVTSTTSDKSPPLSTISTELYSSTATTTEETTDPETTTESTPYTTEVDLSTFIISRHPVSIFKRPPTTTTEATVDNVSRLYYVGKDVINYEDPKAPKNDPSYWYDRKNPNSPLIKWKDDNTRY